MILTDDEIDSVYSRLRGDTFEQALRSVDFARAIEQAILEKIGEPVAWKDRTYGNVHDSNYGYESWIPLYKLPDKK